MQINLDQALEIAQKQKEIGACSCNGQAIILIFNELESVKHKLEMMTQERNFLSGLVSRKNN